MTAKSLFRLDIAIGLAGPIQETTDNVSALHGQTRAGTAELFEADYALRGLVGIEALKQSTRLAGLCGGALLILTALAAWPGTSITRLDSYWLVWATGAAVVAAFGGPLLSRQLLSRLSLTRWRLAVTAVMTLNSTAWAFASIVAAGSQPVSIVPLVIAWLALSLAVLPMLSWMPGLLLQLGIQLLFTAAFAFMAEAGFTAFLLPLGLWVSLALLAMTAAVYARRVDLSRSDVHYTTLESSELQKQVTDARVQLRQAEEQRSTLESELAEILQLAEEASRAKTEFLATMSHEIRTPLNGILPILEMLCDTPLNKEQMKMIRTAQNSSRHLLRIINDILDFAKVESGKLQLESIEIEVRDLVDSVTELMSGSARNHNLRVSASVADNVPQVVRGDPMRLRQILINLVSNAIKFTEEGGIRVEVSCGQVSEKEVELLFAVADTGVGMSEETADRLFHSFTQADASTTRKHGGTGLGLVICKHLVELMGGEIGVRSSLGHGSTFWFLVPLRRSVMEVPSARRDLNRVRVLTLVGNPEAAAVVSAHLRSWGVLEEKATGPADALSKLQSAAMLGASWAYEMVLIDSDAIEQRLPNLLAEIRGSEGLAKIKVVVAVKSEALAQKIKRNFGAVVLTDALRPEPLRRILHRLFDVEPLRFGNTELRPEEVYDDLNVSVEEAALDDVPAVVEGEFSGLVLLVEDNPVNLGVVRKMLSKIGLRCEMAANGSEALARFGQQRFDIIFMDCQMPVMDGYEATGQMRRLEAEQGRAPTPIIAMTANAMAGDREKCLLAGMDDYLAKPVSVEQLRACVSGWLKPAAETSQRANPEADVVEKPQQEEKMMILDQGVLSELREIMEDDYLSLLRTYLRNAPQLVAELRDAVGRSDAAAMVNPAHSLKSSSANVGAIYLSDRAREVEHLAREGKLAAAEAAFHAVDAAYDDAEKALREHMAEYAAV